MKLFVTSLGLGALMLASSATTLATAEQAHQSEHNMFRKKAKTNKNRRAAVRIFPDKVKRAIHVVARGSNDTQIDFFVFDQQGTLLEHLKMDSGDHESLGNLERGKYIYRVFAGDDETANGDFEVR